MKRRLLEGHFFHEDLRGKVSKTPTEPIFERYFWVEGLRMTIIFSFDWNVCQKIHIFQDCWVHQMHVDLVNSRSIHASSSPSKRFHTCGTFLSQGYGYDYVHQEAISMMDPGSVASEKHIKTSWNLAKLRGSPPLRPLPWVELHAPVEDYASVIGN